VLTRDVAPGIHRVEHARTNWYLVEDGDAVTIVDCGFPRSWGGLQSALSELGRSPGQVEAIVLTHAHPDHIGFAERARTEWHVPVWLHERDRSLSRHPFNYEKEHSPLRHVSPYTLRTAAMMGAMGALLTKPIGDVRAFAEEDVLDVPGRPTPLHTPGHTHGHTAFHFADRGAVVVGDALVTVEPYSGKPGPRLVSGAANVDSREAMASLARIAETSAGTVLVGHGPPWTEGAAAAVDRAREYGPS
jgi:glyoxylase-like metal-dependent hydrolase (beta-lactamase superfamily II)